VPEDLSVVIPSHNRPDLLRACLASLARHAPPGSEVVVVDDGSPGGVVAEAARSLPGVRVVSLPARGGFCAAANAGIEAAARPVVELLNDDTEVTAGWAEAALARFRDPRVAAVAPLVLCWPGGGPGAARVDSAGDRYYLGGVAGKRGHGEVLGPAHLCPCRVFGASGSSAFYRRDVLRRVGAFPAGFGAYFEDVDLAFRLHRAGYEVVFEPAARVLHHLGASHGRPAGALLEQQSRNEERVFWRNVPGRDLPRAVRLHLAVLAAKAWRRWREGTLAPFLRGRLRVLGEVPALLRHRQALQGLGPAAAARQYGVESQFWGMRPCIQVQKSTKPATMVGPLGYGRELAQGPAG
jgi:GT2 family glycosyltransferase